MEESKDRSTACRGLNQPKLKMNRCGNKYINKKCGKIIGNKLINVEINNIGRGHVIENEYIYVEINNKILFFQMCLLIFNRTSKYFHSSIYFDNYSYMYLFSVVAGSVLHNS